MKHANKLAVAFVVITIAIIGVVAYHGRNTNSSNKSGTLAVVAGENFWGNLVAQVGGSHVKVTSIVSDPNADPHEYETTNADARTFANADYVILNGAGYDSWGDKLISANPRSDRKVLNIADLIGKKDGDNPHFWYSPDYVNQMVKRVEADLEALEPADKTYFQSQLKKTQESLAGYQNKIAAIKQQHGGTKVAATEDIFVYLADAAGLNLISPPGFIEAVAEGNDPPSQSIAQFQQQLQNKEPKVLVYNQQTVTPLTDNVKKIATDQGIPIVGVTETLHPLGASFQDWMGAEITDLQKALGGSSQ